MSHVREINKRASHHIRYNLSFVCSVTAKDMKPHQRRCYSSPCDICQGGTRTKTNDESGHQERRHSILQISLRCNESLRATCSLHPLKQAATSSIFSEAKVKSTSVRRCSLLVSSVQNPHSRHTRQRACVGEPAAAARCADNEKKTSNRNTAKSE